MAAIVLVVLLASGDTFGELEQAYRRAVTDSDWITAGRVAERIAALGEGRAARFLHQELRMAVDVPLQRALFRVLAFAKFRSTREFVNAHVGSEDPYRRAIALEALAGLDPPRALQRASDLLGIDDDRRVRRTAIEVLARAGTAECARALVENGAGLAPWEQDAIVHALRRFDDAALGSLYPGGNADARVLAVLVLVKRGTEAARSVLGRAREDEDRRVALLARAALSDDGRLPALMKNARSFEQRWELYDLIARAGLRRKPFLTALANAAQRGPKPIRAKAAESLGAVGGAAAVPQLTALLRASKPWQLPIGAARGLAATRAPAAIEPLIAALAKTTGRLQGEIGDALESLTGQPFGLEAELWAKWWRERGSGFEVPEIAPALWEEQTAAADRYAFYGIELHTDRAAFVCDVSGSMQGKRIETLKRELGFVVRRFPPAGRFNFVFFNQDVRAWSKKLVPATPKAKEKALDLVGNLEADGATNIWDALQAGLGDAAVDTVVLLTDGTPTAGKVRAPAEIAKRFLEQNRTRMVLLHVVSIGQDAPYLRDMARLSGGTYRVVAE